MAETLSIISHLALACIAAYIISQGKAPFWNYQGYLVYIVYGIAGIVGSVVNNNRNIAKIYTIAHDVAYVFAPSFFCVGVAIGIYKLQESLAYAFLIVPVLYVASFFVKIDQGLIQTLTQVVCLCIATFCALKENYEGTIAGVLFLVACFMDHIHSSSSAKDISVVNGILAVGCIALWYAFGGHF